MARTIPFTFLTDADERNLIARLAKRLERSQSDAVRFLVLSAARELELTAPAQTQGQQREVKYASAD